jgi:hypothetical protein
VTVAPAMPVATFLALVAFVIPSNLHAQVLLAGEALIPGNRVRIVSEANRGEFTVVAVADGELRVTSDRGGGAFELVLPIESLDALWVARRGQARDQRPSRWGGASIGAAAGFGTGFVLGMRTEYGSEAGLGFGLVLALPGATIGGVVGEIRGRRRVYWEPLGLPLHRVQSVR